MIQLADMHCHLLAGIDDGPRTWEDSLAMCRIASEQGVRHVQLLAHQCERWNVQATTIRERVLELRQRLADAGIEMSVYPTAEIMASPELVENWSEGKLVSIGDHKRYLLVEMPNGLFVDLRFAFRQLGQQGVRVVLAHPEYYPELLYDTGRIEEWIRLGCLVQVSSKSITDPDSRESEKAIRSWIRRGCVHFLGSDGHSPRKRQPLMAAAYQRIREWAGDQAARRIGSENGLRVLKNESLRIAPPQAEKRWWSALRIW